MTAGTITMTDGLSNPALLRLMSWMSPSFPVGAFAYSHGLERAVHDATIGSPAQLQDWLVDLITIGSALERRGAVCRKLAARLGRRRPS